MNKWMYKVRDEMKKYIERETASWTQDHKDILAKMLIEMVEVCLTQRALDAAFICANCGHAANVKHCVTCGLDNPPRQ